MSGTLIDTASYAANSVPSLLQTDAAEGQATGASHGGVGNSNAAAQVLANRTAWLYTHRAALTGNANYQFAVAPATSANQAVNLGQFPSSLGFYGYKKYPDPNSPTGYFIEQWGTFQIGAPSPIAFPIQFPNYCLNVQVSEQAASGSWGNGDPTVHGVSNITVSGYQAWAESWTGNGWIGGSITQAFRAIGY